MLLVIILEYVDITCNKCTIDYNSIILLRLLILQYSKTSGYTSGYAISRHRSLLQ